MTWKEQIPGDWPDISCVAEYQRLVGLARRRLGGYEQHAEDVVSRAMIRWRDISADKTGIARLEQVVKSEAFSLLRSEARRREREAKVYGDPSSPLTEPNRPHSEHDALLLKQALAETARWAEIPLVAQDIEVLELLFAGYSISAVVRKTGFPRHQVRRSRLTLQELVRRTLIDQDPEPAPSSTPRKR